MTLRLGDRLNAARQRQFVGRAAEQDLFQSAIQARELPFCLLYIFGPGGVGKTTLLGRFADLCRQHNLPYTSIDARNVEPSAEAFVQALRSAMGLDPAEAPLQRLAAHSRHVLLIDTYELLAPLDAWLRDTFLPQVPANVLVVLAGRNPPSSAWRGDAGWQTVIRLVPLQNLNAEESRAYLEKRAIPVREHGEVLDFTHGHPLALSLVADVFAQRPHTHFQPVAAPDIIKTLLEQFAQKVPDAAHRTALEACALVRLTTETLLAEMLGKEDAHELFDWLRGLSFIESASGGLFPHDLAREALCADLRWRNPDWYAELHRRARAYYARGLQATQGPAQQRVVFDYVFLHRDNPLVRPFLEWHETGSSAPSRMTPTDEPALVAMVREHEGDESARLAAFWLARQPRNVTVYRDAAQQPIGFLLALELHAADLADLHSDPGTCAAWGYLQRQAPLRAGEGAAIFRFWMGRDTYQDVSAVQSLIFVNTCQYYLNTPGLAFTFSLCATPAFWEPAFTYMDLARIPDVDFTVGGRTYSVFGHDWRSVPPLAWLDRLAARELATGPLDMPAPAAVPGVLVLSEADFASAVRDALQHFRRPDALRDNPLLRSRLVLEAAGGSDSGARISALLTLVNEAAEALTASPREAKAYRALYHTYLHPAATQEQAAELLDVPFSTFRRHLKTGLNRVTGILWQRELQRLVP